MNHLLLKSIIKQYKDTPEEQLNEALQKDDRNFSEESIAEIQSAIKKYEEPEVSKKEVLPNDNLDLSGFDYDNLTGESFEKYQELVNKLPGHENRDFVQYMASGVFKTVLNDNADKVIVLVGIKINQIKPVNQTRVPVQVVRNLNAQIMDRNNPASNSRYYLLKK